MCWHAGMLACWHMLAGIRHYPTIPYLQQHHLHSCHCSQHQDHHQRTRTFVVYLFIPHFTPPQLLTPTTNPPPSQAPGGQHYDRPNPKPKPHRLVDARARTSTKTNNTDPTSRHTSVRRVSLTIPLSSSSHTIGRTITPPQPWAASIRAVRLATRDTRL
jgi:hypothetical protein